MFFSYFFSFFFFLSSFFIFSFFHFFIFLFFFHIIIFFSFLFHIHTVGLVLKILLNNVKELDFLLDYYTMRIKGEED